MSKIITHHSAARMVGVDALDPDKHTHLLVSGRASVPERFWIYTVGTEEELIAVQAKIEGYIVPIDFGEVSHA